MAKRTAEKELTDRNWDQHEDVSSRRRYSLSRHVADFVALLGRAGTSQDRSHRSGGRPKVILPSIPTLSQYRLPSRPLCTRRFSSLSR